MQIFGYALTADEVALFGAAEETRSEQMMSREVKLQSAVNLIDAKHMGSIDGSEFTDATPFDPTRSLTVTERALADIISAARPSVRLPVFSRSMRVFTIVSCCVAQRVTDLPDMQEAELREVLNVFFSKPFSMDDTPPVNCTEPLPIQILQINTGVGDASIRMVFEKLMVIRCQNAFELARNPLTGCVCVLKEHDSAYRSLRCLDVRNFEDRVRLEMLCHFIIVCAESLACVCFELTRLCFVAVRSDIACQSSESVILKSSSL
jgi:hypothetical protein